MRRGQSKAEIGRFHGETQAVHQRTAGWGYAAKAQRLLGANRNHMFAYVMYVLCQ